MIRRVLYLLLGLFALFQLSAWDSVARADGATQLTFGFPVACCPSWWPGSQILLSRGDFWGGDGIWVVSGTGGTPTQISTWGFAPTWSHDGSMIVFSDWIDIWVMSATGDNATRLTSTVAPDSALLPTWSPDGSQIAYESGNESDNWNIWSVPATGGSATQLTFDNYQAPHWSPDGSQILFYGTNVEGANFYVVPANGGATTLINTEYEGVGPRWSPDGSQIAFTDVGPEEGAGDIWVFPVSGGPAIRVTDDPANDCCPAWSLDGSQIAFMSDRSGTWNIWVIDVPTDSVSVQELSWGAIKGLFR
jgi:Tol biopolymer transport system component